MKKALITIITFGAGIVFGIILNKVLSVDNRPIDDLVGSQAPSPTSPPDDFEVVRGRSISPIATNSNDESDDKSPLP